MKYYNYKKKLCISIFTYICQDKCTKIQTIFSNIVYEASQVLCKLKLKHAQYRAKSPYIFNTNFVIDINFMTSTLWSRCSVKNYSSFSYKTAHTIPETTFLLNFFKPKGHQTKY